MIEYVLHRGVELLIAGQPQTALDLYRSLLDHDPVAHIDYISQYEIFNNLGVACFLCGNYAEALEAFDSAAITRLKMHHSHPLKFARSVKYLALGGDERNMDSVSGLDIKDSVLQLCFFECYHNKGVAFLALGRIRNALRSFEHCYFYSNDEQLKRDCNLAMISCLIRLGEDEAALAIVNDVISVSPYRIEAYVLRSYLYQRGDKLMHALNDLRKARALAASINALDCSVYIDITEILLAVSCEAGQRCFEDKSDFVESQARYEEALEFSIELLSRYLTKPASTTGKSPCKDATLLNFIDYVKGRTAECTSPIRVSFISQDPGLMVFNASKLSATGDWKQNSLVSTSSSRVVDSVRRASLSNVPPEMFQLQMERRITSIRFNIAVLNLRRLSSQGGSALVAAEEFQKVVSTLDFIEHATSHSDASNFERDTLAYSSCLGLGIAAILLAHSTCHVELDCSEIYNFLASPYSFKTTCLNVVDVSSFCGVDSVPPDNAIDMVISDHLHGNSRCQLDAYSLVASAIQSWRHADDIAQAHLCLVEQAVALSPSGTGPLTSLTTHSDFTASTSDALSSERFETSPFLSRPRLERWIQSARTALHHIKNMGSGSGPHTSASLSNEGGSFLPGAKTNALSDSEDHDTSAFKILRDSVVPGEDRETTPIATARSCTHSVDFVTEQSCDALVGALRHDEGPTQYRLTDLTSSLSETPPQNCTYDIRLLLYPGPYPSGVDVSRREGYLDDPAFRAALGVTRAQFDSLPRWKQVRYFISSYSMTQFV